MVRPNLSFLIVILTLRLLPGSVLATPDTEAAQAALNGNLETVLQQWGDDYVRYIMTEKERKDYRELISTQDRLFFIEQFWKRRDPTPETAENEFRTEYQNRFITATSRFSCGKAGWKTDRGRIYITLGPPSAINSAPTGAGAASVPSEVWTYNGLPHVKLKASFDVIFADFSGAGDYELVSGLTDKIQFFTRDGYLMSGLEGYARLRVDGSLTPSGLDGGANRTINESNLLREQLDFMNLLEEVGSTANQSIRPVNPSVDTFYSFKSLPFRFQTALFPGPDQATSLLILLELDPENLEQQAVEPFRCEFRLILSVVRTADTSVVESLDEVHTFKASAKPESQNSYLYDGVLTLEAGDYLVRCLVLDTQSHAVGSKIISIAIPGATPDATRWSSPLVIRSIAPKSPETAISSVLMSGNQLLIPAVEGVVDQPECYLYWVIYGLNQPALAPPLRFLCRTKEFDETRTLALAPIVAEGRDALALIQKIKVDSLTPGSHRLFLEIFSGNQLTKLAIQAETSLVIPKR